MAETSLPWGGSSVGHCGPYTSTVWAEMQEILFSIDSRYQAILPWYGSKLKVEAHSANNVRVLYGAAIVNGTFYKNSSTKVLFLSSPVSPERTDYIVLRKNTSEQTVTLVVKEGATSLQQDSSIYEVKLASVTINSGGAITLIVEDFPFIQIGVPVSGVIHSTSTTVPLGYTELAEARGRFILGMPVNGAMKGTVGTALTNLGTITHTHTYTEVPRHRHGSIGRAAAADDLNRWEQMLGIIWGSTHPTSHKTAGENGAMDYEGSATCTTSQVDVTPPYIQLMTLVKS